MNKIKKNWQVIIIIVLLLFSLSKCTQSCNRQLTINKNISEISQRDSVINALNDSIILLNHNIDLLTNDKSNQQKLIDSQKESIDKINEAKKNIQVTVRK